MHQRWYDGSLREVALQLVPNPGYVGNVAFQLISAAAGRPCEHVREKFSKRAELQRRAVADEPCESRHWTWQVLHSFGGIKEADQRWAPLGYVGMLQPTREVPTREPAIHGEQPPVALAHFDDQWQLQTDVAAPPALIEDFQLFGCLAGRLMSVSIETQYPIKINREHLALTAGAEELIAADTESC